MYKNESVKNSIINIIWGSIMKEDGNYPEIILEDIMSKKFKKLRSHKATVSEYTMKLKRD